MGDGFEDLDSLGEGSEEIWIVRNWLFILLAALSLLWAIFAYILMYSSSSCLNFEQKLHFLDFGGVTASKLACRPVNEIGDFLAGAFSPLAFLWLFAAVILQRKELSAQRRELALSRAVSVAQTKEARRNVNLLKAQTEVFEEQRKREELEDNDREIQTLVDTFVRELNSIGGVKSDALFICIDLPDGGEKRVSFIKDVKEVGDTSVSLHRSHILQCMKEIEELQTSFSYCNFHAGSWVFEHVNKYKDIVKKYIPKVSVSKEYHLRQVGLFALIYRLEQVEALFCDLDANRELARKDPEKYDKPLKIGVTPS